MTAPVLPLIEAVALWPARGALIGLDLGTKTVGVAVSDPDRRLATGVATVQRTAFTKDAAKLLAIAQERNASGFVLGLPINMDGSEGPRAQSTRAFARNFAVGLIALIVLVTAWDLLSRALGREVTAAFMVDVLKSAQADNAVWLLVLAFCVAAPVTEELFVRGFLFRGWAESWLRPVGAILLSSLVWTAMHLQYDWFFFAEIMSIGVLFGYLRYRTGSTWLTVVLHAINNLAATIQTMWLATH
jgi:putative transcription antitermination factor YqgF